MLGGVRGLFGRSGQLFLFEHHVAVLDGVKDLAALLALDKLRVLIARDNAHLRMFALRRDGRYGRNGKILTRPGKPVNAVFSQPFRLGTLSREAERAEVFRDLKEPVAPGKLWAYT